MAGDIVKTYLNSRMGEGWMHKILVDQGETVREKEGYLEHHSRQ